LDGVEMVEIEYKIRPDGKYTKGCNFCDCEVALGEFTWEHNEYHEESEKIKYLCEVCASTLIGQSRDSEETHITHKIIAQVANHLKQKLNLF